MVHRTMQGREVDMEKLARANELMPAIGNMGVNARGDELGNGGVVVRKREEVVADYYEVTKPAKKVAPAPVKSEEPDELDLRKNTFTPKNLKDED